MLAIARLVLILALAAGVLGAACELALPGAANAIDTAGALCALATWVSPWLIATLPTRGAPRTSLAGVGVAIRMALAAAFFSTLGVALALVTLAFAHGGQWASVTLTGIAAFWLAGAAWLLVIDRRARARGR